MDNFKVCGNDVFIHEHTNIVRPNLVHLGNHIAIDFGFHCTTSINIGDYVHIGPHVSCIGGEQALLNLIGFNNIMAGARIVCGSDRFDDSGLFGALIPKQFKGRQIIEPVTIEMFANVGTNSIIMPGSILRKGSLLAAGSLLIGDTEEWGIYKGNPAKLIKKINSKNIINNAKKMGY